jgi:hypothetical protein
MIMNGCNKYVIEVQADTADCYTGEDGGPEGHTKGGTGMEELSRGAGRVGRGLRG